MVHDGAPTKAPNTLPNARQTELTRAFDKTFNRMLQNTIGFDYLPELFNKSNQSFPHYDIYKQDDNTYVVQIALAGYSPEDIIVSQTDWDLMVSCEAQHNNDQQTEYQYKSIAKRSFTLRIGLAPHTEVTDAVMKNGMLYVTVHRHRQDSNRPIEVRKE